ncbi:hypothetical protein RDWZM_003186 [Blomia tropicalis]|uniref:Uncharacterized protein n=1 Tax=Blomia tropicalis TaxID=40697 RepID=A0A9Q0MES0_BLOTA|nr:hypothetical protein RDWZM_003186 [Blomia tropicalis]
MNAKDTSVKLRKEIVLIYNLVMATVELDEQDVVQINKVLNDYKEWNRSVLKSNDEIIIDENEEAVYRQMILVLKERLMTTKPPRLKRSVSTPRSSRFRGIFLILIGGLINSKRELVQNWIYLAVTSVLR